MKIPTNGPVMFDLMGTDIHSSEVALLESPAAGGIILFSRNYQTPEQLRKLIQDIREIRPDMLIAVDHEGGRVQRFRAGFTSLPPAASYLNNGDAAETLAHQAGWLMAMELRSLDIDLSFAPVLDVDAGISEIIGNRAFAREPEAVARLASRFMNGMHKAGMAATGKHFPGHGNVAADSHLELPIDRRTQAEIFDRDIRPFQALIAQGLDAIMPAHVVYPAVDSEAAGYSKIWLQNHLQGSLGFKGIIFSDDLTMVGAESAGCYGARARKAMQAGCDMVLVCNAPDGAAEVLEEKSTRTRDPGRAHRINTLRGRFPVDRETLLTSPEWRQAVHDISTLNEIPTK